MTTGSKTVRRARRHMRIRARVVGTEQRPRLAVFRSNTRICAQIINDDTGNTLAAVSTADSKKGSTKERIEEAAQTLSDLAKKKGITTVVFDRGGFPYIGNIKLFADTVRASGITF